MAQKQTLAWIARAEIWICISFNPQFQHYLMADVLESQFSLLLKKIDLSNNFEELRHSHDVFINSVTAHTFINNKPVSLAEKFLQCLFTSYCIFYFWIKFINGWQQGLYYWPDLNLRPLIMNMSSTPIEPIMQHVIIRSKARKFGCWILR